MTADNKTRHTNVEGQSIVIVNDTPDNLHLLSEILHAQGYRVRPVPDGARALAMIRKSPADLIILDIMTADMDGYQVCGQLKADEKTKNIPVIFALGDTPEKLKAFAVGGEDYISKPFQAEEVLARVKTQLELKKYRHELQYLVKQRTEELELRNAELTRTKQELQAAMKNLQTVKITDGVYWLQILEADLYILCGCPADVVKLMKKKGFISLARENDITFETGPNAILLSDISIQNGEFSNLAEFPVLQMLYRQGMLLPGHPNNTGQRPMLIGSEAQVKAQMKYIYRGNYGLISREEIMASGIDEKLADVMMDLKKKFAFGKIRPTEELLEARILKSRPLEIKNGVFAQRIGLNRYRFEYKGKSTTVDLNLNPHEDYEPPFPWVFHQFEREYFAVIHSGEGDGWDENRPCMGSILMYHGKIYLIDAGPNILHSLRALSIDISEIEGIFHTHAHDDHFAGLPTLIQSGHRLKYYATPLVRNSVAKKLSALMSMDENKFFEYFDVNDLQFDIWNDLNGLEIMPLFSPHPLETSIFLFRTLGQEGYKTYAHWADIISLDILEKMLGGTDNAIYETVRQNYHARANIKKVDIGGGLIHGEAIDFINDDSEEIILAHYSTPLNEQQKEIGSERSFGTVDVLIPSNHNYLRQLATRHMTSYFPDIAIEQLQTLLNASVVSFNPGTIILKKEGLPDDIYLILTGTVEFISSDSNIQNHLSNGCFVGDVPLLKKAPSNGTWRALSYVRAMRFSAALYNSFLEKFGLYEQLLSVVDKLEFLQGSFLFGEGISFPVQNSIARDNDFYALSEGQRLPYKEEPMLCLLRSGELQIKNSRDEVIETVLPGDFCGEESFLDKGKILLAKASRPSEVFLIKKFPLLEIPVVHWKMLERLDKRFKG